MKHWIISGWLVAMLVLISATVVRGEVNVAADRNDLDSATPKFEFKNVSSPVKNTAAAKAKIAIVDGERDQNGGDVTALNDGQLPSDQDEPSTNFFFNAGTEGGRLVIDLGSAINVKQVNTYSWHADTRAPQVYTLYAAGGDAAGFDAKPGKDVDPEKVGWKLIAKVDTRPKTGSPGGQYGVSISDSTGNLGKYRYLLIAASRTEADDDWGKTFFSELNIIDADKPIPAAGKETADEGAVKVLTIDGGKYTATIDTSKTPDLTDWADKKVAPAVVEWYPKIVAMLPSEGYRAPTEFSITFKKNMDGVAYTMGTSVVGGEKYFKAHSDDVGAIVHEMVHVVQQYRSQNNPGWMVEGTADYVRWFNYEPANKHPKPNPNKAKYTDSYQTTAAFLDYLVRAHDKDFISKINADMRHGKYSDELWKTYAGKSASDLWDEYIATLKK